MSRLHRRAAGEATNYSWMATTVTDTLRTRSSRGLASACRGRSRRSQSRSPGGHGVGEALSNGVYTIMRTIEFKFRLPAVAASAFPPSAHDLIQDCAQDALEGDLSSAAAC